MDIYYTNPDTLMIFLINIILIPFSPTKNLIPIENPKLKNVC